ncbi:DoxX family protein [Agaribacterium sp. ZY112]|uniref:DoxX family protein n=1 Tax=Agaribacterium sp. ZY112 TaxID=3233574 RepID=UPI003525F040
MYQFPNQFNKPDLACLLLRLALGLVLLAHSVYLKLFVFGLAGTAQFFTSIGLPYLLAYFVFFLELIAGLMLLVGYHSRLVALMVLPVLLGATWAHWGSGWLFTNTGGGWEYPLFLLFTSLAVVFLGGGRYALKPST